MTQQELVRRLWNALIETHGGPEVEAMLIEHARGRSLDSLAAEHGLSRSAVHRRIVRLRGTLSAAGVLPKEYEKPVPEKRDGSCDAAPSADN